MSWARKCLILLVGITMSLGLLDYFKIGQSNLKMAFVAANNISGTSYIQNQPSLKNLVNIAMSGASGHYAIVIKNFKTGESYNLNEHDPFETGSLYKLWVMGEVYTQISQGKLTHDQELDQQIAVLNREFDIPPDVAELQDGEIDMSVDEALTQMITISHNYAAMLLTEAVKNSSLDELLRTYQLTESHTGEPPTSTASDMAKLLELIYQGKVVNPQASSDMLKLLKGQQLNDGLPKLLPDNIMVAHKTGDIDFDKHDAGIVFSPKGDYIIVVLSETDSPSTAQRQIAKVSEAVYQYFNK